jgi:hypothetical protein
MTALARQSTPPGDAPSASGWARAVIALYAAAALFFFIGFATHQSSVAVIGPYTPGYAAFLGILAMLLLIPLGLMIAAIRLLGPGRALRAAGALTVFVLAVYAASEVAYAATRHHAFDPFLQFPGARFDHVEKSPAEGMVRVVTLGGSTTRNVHLPPELRYPSVLETVLTEDGASFEVLNAGMDWWTTKHSHINYVTYLRDWQPEVAVVMHAINDLYRSFAPPRFSVGPYNVQWSHFYGPAIRGAKPRSLAGVNLNRWSVWELNRRWYRRWRYREMEYDKSEFRSLPEFEFNLRSLIGSLKADGVRVILLTQPSLYKAEMSFNERANLWFPSTFCVTPRGTWVREIPSGATMARAMEMYNLATVRIGMEEGVEVVDLAGSVPRTMEFFGDDVHYTERGAATVARLVADAVSRGH